MPIFTGNRFGFGAAAGGIVASGGTIINSAGYRIHVFTSPGSFKCRR